MTKTITIQAPVDAVYGFLAAYENFPRFTPDLRAVRDLGNGRSHWIANGPDARPIAWDVVITKRIPNKLLAWQSLPDALIANAGSITCQPNADGSTRVDMRFSYRAQDEAISPTVAMLFGADPHSQVDDRLAKLKTWPEAGATNEAPEHEPGLQQREQAVGRELAQRNGRRR